LDLKLKTKSPIPSDGGLFSLDPNTLMDKFHPIGVASRGKLHILLLGELTSNYTQLKIVPDIIEHSCECKQFLIIGAEERIIGSVFEVPYKLLDLTEDRIVIRDSDEINPFTCSAETGPGSVLVFNDTEGSTVVIPSAPKGDLLRYGT